MMSFGWQELAIVLVIVIVIFGVGKLPEIGSGLGRGIREFKSQVSGGDDELAAHPTATTPPPARIDEPGTEENRELRPDEI